jgi:cofilin
MSVELQALRTAKAAVDEGLMQPTDYNAVKQAFVRALAIKGGVDSGFLGQSDFADARREFFQSLGMSNLGGGSGPVASAQPVPTFPVQAPTPVQQAQIPLAPSVPQTNGTDNSATTPPNRSTQGAAPAPRPPVPLLSIPETQASTAETTPTGIGHLTPQATVCTPSTISNRGGGTAAVASKV